MKLFLQSLLQVPLLQSQHASLKHTSGLDGPSQCSFSTGHQAPLASPPYQGSLKPILNETTEAFITKVLKDWDSPGGVGIAIVRKDKEGQWFVETKGYGVATAQGDRVDENTLFSIGSNSKVCTHPNPLRARPKTFSPAFQLYLSWTSHPQYDAT